MDKRFYITLLAASLTLITNAYAQSEKSVSVPFISSINSEFHKGLKFTYDLRNQTKIVCSVMYVEKSYLTYFLRGAMRNTITVKDSGRFIIVGHLSHRENNYEADVKGEIKLFDENQSSRESYASCESQNDSEYPNV